MSVSAKFIADFTSFTTAVDKAELKLSELRTESGRVEGQLRRMGDSFSGKKILQDAELAAKAVKDLGGVSTLTASEQQRLNSTVTEAIAKYKALGKDAPQHLKDIERETRPLVRGFSSILGVVKQIGPALGVTFGVGAVTSFARSVSDFSGKMLDLEAQTRLTTTRLQAFDFVGGDVDLTIEEITTSADQLAKRLGGDDQSVNDALQKLSLSGQDLKNLDLDEAMFQIDEALVDVTNQMDRARILTDLFGRSGAQLGRLMDGSLRQIIKTAEETGPVIDRELLKKADRFGEMWEHGWKRFQAAAVTAIDWVVKRFGDLEKAAEAAGRAMREDRSSGQFGGPTQGPVIGPLSTQRRRAPRNITVDSIAPDIISGPGIGTLLRTKEETQALTDALRAADDAAKQYRNHLNEVGIRMMEADAATAAFFRQMGTGIMFMRETQPEALFGRQIPTSLAMFGPGALSGQGGAGLGLRPGSLVGSGGFFGGLGGGLKNLLGGMTGGKGFSGLLSNIGGGVSQGFGHIISGALTGGIASLLGAGISGIGKLFSSIFRNEGKETNRLRDRTIEDFTGISGDKGASQAKFRELAMAAGVASSEIDKLFSTKRTKDFEAAMDSVTKKMNTFADEQEADAIRLTAAIEKYGFSIEQLGPTLQKQRLDAQAKELIEDWRVLVGAGVDLTVVNEKMSEAINEYLQTAIRVGAEIPAAFRPILQKMLEQGTLTDEAGNAITDLEDAGIHFSETMTEGFDRVVQKLDELIQKIFGVGDALNALPSAPSVDVGGKPDPYADQVGFAGGTRGRYLQFGRGTPVMLHGRERVSTEAEGRAEAGAWTSIASEVHGLRQDMARFAEGVQRGMRDQMAIVMGQRV